MQDVMRSFKNVATSTYLILIKNYAGYRSAFWAKGEHFSASKTNAYFDECVCLFTLKKEINYIDHWSKMEFPIHESGAHHLHRSAARIFLQMASGGSLGRQS